MSAPSSPRSLSRPRPPVLTLRFRRPYHRSLPAAARSLMHASGKNRVRFAPSPTGYLHVGSARTFIFNWLFARHTAGTMILRLDDTDVGRNTDVSVASIFEGLKWLDLPWDEYYRQSDPLALH